MPAKAPRRPAKAQTRLFPTWCSLHGLPAPVAEFPFAKDIGRKWRADWAWPEKKVLLEVDGGVWIGGRHTSGAGWMKDTDKLNHAALLGWRCLRCAPKTLMTADMKALLVGILL